MPKTVLETIEDIKKKMRPEDIDGYEAKLASYISTAYPDPDVWKSIIEYLEGICDLVVYDTTYHLPHTYIVRCGYSSYEDSGDSCTYHISITDIDFKVEVEQIDSYCNPRGDYDFECGPEGNDNWEPASWERQGCTFDDPENIFLWVKETVEKMQKSFEELPER